MNHLLSLLALVQPFILSLLDTPALPRLICLCDPPAVPVISQWVLVSLNKRAAVEVKKMSFS